MTCYRRRCPAQIVRMAGISRPNHGRNADEPPEPANSQRIHRRPDPSNPTEARPRGRSGRGNASIRQVYFAGSFAVATPFLGRFVCGYYGVGGAREIRDPGPPRKKRVGRPDRRLFCLLGGPGPGFPWRPQQQNTHGRSAQEKTKPPRT